MRRVEMREVTITSCDKCSTEVGTGVWYSDTREDGQNGGTIDYCSACWWEMFDAQRLVEERRVTRTT